VALCRVLTRFVHSEPRDWCAGCLSRETCTLDRLRDSFGTRSTEAQSLEVALRDDDYPFLVGSPATREIDRIARQLADSDLTVLIRGASGTGKEVVARHLHRVSSRRKGPFVKVNCAAVPEALLESELFGHARGAFTGAVTSKVGKFEESHRGTIFLDEISEMSVGLQAKLLEVLQDKCFTRLGHTGSVSVDTRILAATNRNLEEEVESGRFREDLYFRLKVIDLYLPPLKDRREEIPLFLDYFCCRFAHKFRRPAPELDERLLEMLLSYDWPGNVRELENLVKRAVVLGEETVLNELTEKKTRRRRARDDGASRGTSRAPRAVALKEAAAHAALTTERELILSALERTRWNRKDAARLLGVSYRTIRAKIKRYALETN
jgi:two-component system response regulator AtoC